MPTDSPWMTKEEAARRARVSVGFLEKALAAGLLRSRRLGGRVLIHRDWIDAWIEGFGDPPAEAEAATS